MVRILTPIKKMVRLKLKVIFKYKKLVVPIIFLSLNNILYISLAITTKIIQLGVEDGQTSINFLHFFPQKTAN